MRNGMSIFGSAAAAFVPQATERPSCMLRDGRVIACCQLLQAPDNEVVRRMFRSNARISEGHAGIANQPAPFGAFDRAASENSAKLFFIERHQPIERRGEK